jgi:hypothetical protein
MTWNNMVPPHGIQQLAKAIFSPQNFISSIWSEQLQKNSSFCTKVAET